MNNKKEIKPKGYWTYEKCKEIALTCDTIKSLAEEHSTVYSLIIKNKWYELKSHCKPIIYWSLEKCIEEISKYKNLKDFRENNRGAICAIQRNKWEYILDPIRKNNKVVIKNYEICKEECLKYNNYREFQKKSKNYYAAIVKNKWYELTEHMERSGNLVKRLIYVYIFSDKSAYIGLTCNKNNRHDKHMIKGTVFEYMQLTGLNPIRTLLTDYIDVEEAVKLEKYYVEYYKNLGYRILNKRETGGLGGSIDKKWTYENCKNLAILCKNKHEFYKKYLYAFNSSSKNKWIDEFFPSEVGMNFTKKWYYENTKLKTMEYKDKNEFKEKARGAYKAAYKNGWLSEFFPNDYKPRIKWDYEKCKLAASKFNKRYEFKENFRGAYNTSKKCGWLDEFFPK